MPVCGEVELTLLGVLNHFDHYFFKFLETLSTFGGRDGENIKDHEDLDARSATQCGVFTHVGGYYTSALELVMASNRTPVVVNRTV